MNNAGRNYTEASAGASCRRSSAPSTSASASSGTASSPAWCPAEAAGVDGGRDEVVTEGVHRHQRRHPDGVAEVIGVDALGQRRAGGRLGGEEARRLALAQVGADERVGEAGEVGAAADAADHDV